MSADPIDVAEGLMAEQNLHSLLAEVRAFLRRFVLLSDEQAVVVTLWVAHTHAIGAADATPFLAVLSAEKGSGKTRLLEVVELLVREPLRTVSASEAALFRTIEEKTPTLLLDEVDAVFGPKARDNEALRAILNAGNRRGSNVLRMVGEGNSLKAAHFSVFCPRALAGLGRLPDTVADRSFPIRMKKRARHESEVERFRHRYASAEAAPIRMRLESWAAANAPGLREALPALPEELSDRAQDGAEPLLAIADLAGGDWPERARFAIVRLCTGDNPEEDSLGVRLLRDCRGVFDAQPEVDRLTSAELCSALVAIEESPWGAFKDGTPLSVRALSRILNQYEIGSGSIRLPDGKTPKGYYRESFEDAWNRFLPPPFDVSSATPPQPAPVLSFLDFSNRHTSEPVAEEKHRIVNNDGPCGAVADKSPVGEGVGACGYFVGESRAGLCGRCAKTFAAHEGQRS